MTFGMSLFAALAGFWLVAAGTLAMGIGSGLFGPIWNVYVAERVPARVRGQVLGLTNAIGAAPRARSGWACCRCS